MDKNKYPLRIKNPGQALDGFTLTPEDAAMIQEWEKDPNRPKIRPRTGRALRVRDMCIQLQPDLVPSVTVDENAFLDAIKEVFKVKIEAGDDNGRYVNIVFRTTEPVQDLAKIKDIFTKVGGSSCSIVVCEGEDGWNDYLLLHHFLPGEKLDINQNCKITGNLCGTDTWTIGQPCKCENCQKYIKLNDLHP